MRQYTHKSGAEYVSPITGTRHYRFNDGGHARWFDADSFDQHSEHVILDSARAANNAPIWRGPGSKGWALFTGWAETFDTVRATIWKLENPNA